MDEARGRRRHVPTRAALVTAVLLAVCPSALALNPALDISQYAHTAWLVRDGFSKGFITCFAQTADGFLWLGSEFGLLRFDGVRAIPWQPPAGQSLADVRIRSLLAARDGTLWIGTIDKGVVSWKDGKLTQYPPLAGNGINALVEDRDGTVWIGAQDSQKGRLCASRAGQLRCYGTDGDLGPVNSLYEEPGGTLWVGTTSGLWQWKSDSTLHRISGVAVNLAGLAKGDDGELLIGTIAGGIRRLADGSEEVFHLPGLTRQFDGLAFKLLRDRDGP